MKVFKSCKVLAISLMVFGIVLFTFNFSNTKYEEYGGDAYTGIQNASADTANNVIEVGGYLVFAIGIMLSCYCDIKKFEYEENQKKHKELIDLLTFKKNEICENDIEDTVHNVDEDDEFECLKCGKKFSAAKNQDIVTCPWCNAKFKIY